MPVYPDPTLDNQQRQCDIHMLPRLESWGLGAVAEKLTLRWLGMLLFRQARVSMADPPQSVGPMRRYSNCT